MRATDGRGQPVHPMQRQVRCDVWTTFRFDDGTESPARCQGTAEHIGRHWIRCRTPDGDLATNYWTDTTSEKRRTA